MSKPTPVMTRVALALLSVALAAAPRGPHAWGAEGHRIVAEIAEQFLEPETARQVCRLLATDGLTTLAEVSTWADQILPQRRETARWRFADIPLGAPSFDPARDCPHDACVVAQIFPDTVA
jgi:hypothetical protein